MYKQVTAMFMASYMSSRYLLVCKVGWAGKDLLNSSDAGILQMRHHPSVVNPRLHLRLSWWLERNFTASWIDGMGKLGGSSICLEITFVLWFCKWGAQNMQIIWSEPGSGNTNVSKLGPNPQGLWTWQRAFAKGYQSWGLWGRESNLECWSRGLTPQR